MRRPVCVRLFAAVWALWFAAVLSEPAPLHVCSMHGSGHGASHAADVVALEAHAHAGANADGPAPIHAPSSKHTGCTCIGGCCAVIAAALPPITALRSVAVTSATVSAITSPAVVYRPTTPAYARPPSHAPPFFTA